MRRFQGVAASLFACACVASCGKTTSLVDAGGNDANTTDSNTTIDATPAGDVTVTTYSRCCDDKWKTPKADIQVVSIQPDGSPGPTGMTDANGTATLSGVKQGASVTVAYPLTGGGYQLVTTMGVKPGDNLVYGDIYNPNATGGTGNITINFPAIAAAANIYAYYACNGNGSTTAGATTSITLPVNCDLPTTNVLLVATDDGGVVVGTGIVKGVTLADAQSGTLASWNTVTANGFTESMSGAFDQVNEVDFYAQTVADGVAGDQVRQYQSGYGYVSQPTGTPSIMTTVGPGDRIFAWATLYPNLAVGNKEAYVAVAPTATSASFDVPGLPWLTSISVASAAEAATWFNVGKGSYDGSVAFLNWCRSDGGEGCTSSDWTIIIPPGTTTLSWSNTPPAEIADLVPNETDFVNGSLQSVDLSSTNGYDDLRNVPEWQITCPYCATEDGELPTGSSLADGGEGGFVGHQLRVEHQRMRQTLAHVTSALRAAR
jgi:hypothetical protein